MDLNLRLIYKASRDGFGKINFHDRCDNLNRPAVFIIKSKKFGKIFGGYTDLNFDKNKNKLI